MLVAAAAAAPATAPPPFCTHPLLTLSYLFTPTRLSTLIWPSFTFVWPCQCLYPSPYLLVHACLHPLIHACSRLCPFVWLPFTLICAYLPCLFVLVPAFVWPSFMLICACSVVCPFVPICVASICTHLCLLTVYLCLFLPSFGLHSCLFAPAQLFAHVAIMWPPFMLVCACLPHLLALICVCIKYMVSTYILMNTLTFFIMIHQPV